MEPSGVSARKPGRPARLRAEVTWTPHRTGAPIFFRIGALGILALALGTLRTVVDPALPLLQRERGVSSGEGALVSNAVLITGAAVAPVAGELGDRCGGKRVLVRLMDGAAR